VARVVADLLEVVGISRHAALATPQLAHASFLSRHAGDL
jgi:hypothetical protein